MQGWGKKEDWWEMPWMKFTQGSFLGLEGTSLFLNLVAGDSTLNGLQGPK